MLARFSHSTPTASVNLTLAQTYLEGGRQHKAAENLDAAFILYEQAKVSLIKVADERQIIPLSQVKEALRKAQSAETPEDQTLRNQLAAVYLERGDVLKAMGNIKKASASYQKAEMWGHAQAQERLTPPSRPSSTFSSIRSGLLPPAAFLASPRHSSILSLDSPGRDIAQLPLPVFSDNVPPPIIQYDLPEADERLTSTSQLAYCLSLLSKASLPDAVLHAKEQAWYQATADNAEEKERLRTLATEVVRTFVNDELKEIATVHEVVGLAVVLERTQFRTLLMKFVDGIEQSTLLEFDLLEGLAQLIQGAAPGDVEADDLVKILELLGTRLKDTHGQSMQNIYQLTRTVAHVLDAMADSRVVDLNREALHAPLSAYMAGLQESADPYLVYQAAYAFQALQYVPDNETLWQAVLRRTGKVIEGVSGLVSAVKGLNLNEFIEGLGQIQEGIAGATEFIKSLSDGYKGVLSLTENGQNFLESLKEGFSFTRKSAWYPALRGADTLLENGQLADFKQLVCEAPCRRDPAFQWGLCERLGQLAANPAWDSNARQSAMTFLGELYKNEATWGQQAQVKQWILKILMHLKDTPISAQAAKTLLQALEKSGETDKQTLYTTCLNEGPSPYPLNVQVPLAAASTLLDRVQNKPDVETDLRDLKRRRLKQGGEAVYISPQGKPSLQAPDEALFDLTEKVNDFLRIDQKVLLLLGDSGAGKSTFNRVLEANLWKSYEKGGRIPLFISLPAIDQPEQDLVTKQLRKEGFTDPQIRELKAQREFVLICDGYDESQQTHNLYMSNSLNQPGQWRAQMVISCRSEYLGTDYRDRFQPTDRNHHAESQLFQEAVVAPFSVTKMHAYIKDYVRVNKPVWQEADYQQALDQIPHLKDLVRNPFLLTLALEVLPSLVNPGQNLSTAQITRVALYDQFVTQWLERGKKRLADKNLSEQEKKAFGRLANEGFAQNGIAFLTNLAGVMYEQQAGNPIVEYVHFRDKETWKEAFFGEGDMKQLLREASPLNRSGNQYRFIHKSLLEYGVARAIFEPQDAGQSVERMPVQKRRGSVSSVFSFENQEGLNETSVAVEQPVLDSLLARRNLVGEPSIVQFLAERVQHAPLFKQQLLAVIERSKTDKAVRQAAANAITILVRADVQFIGADLKGIQIPGADLSQGVFDSAQLQGADLRKVRLRNTWLHQANLSGVQMAGVQFGEWPYLQEESEVYSCAYSPDGKTYAIGLKNGTVSVYDALNWEKMHTLQGHTDPVWSVTYSPSGQQIASGSNDGTVRLWDAHTGQPGPILPGHTGSVMSVRYSPSGQQIASGSADDTVRLWDAHTGQPGPTLQGHTAFVYSVMYSPSGQQIASGSADNTVRLWDAHTGQPGPVLQGHTDVVRSVTYSPSGEQIASGSKDQTVRLWDAHTGQPGPTLQGHTGEVNFVTYSPSGQQIASGSADHMVRLWDAHTGQLGHTLQGHTNIVMSVTYSPSGEQIASGSLDQTVRLWDARTGQFGLTLQGHTNGISSVAYSPSGRQIVFGSWDHTVHLWDAHTGQPGLTLQGHTKGVNSVTYSPSGKQIASGSADHTVRLWDAHTGQPGPTLQGHTNGVNSVEYSPSGEQIASGSKDHTVRLWDAHTGQPGPTLCGHTNYVNSVAYSPSGEQIASGSEDHTVRLWDAHTGQPGPTLCGHTNYVNSVAYSPSGGQIASGGADQTVRLWDAHTGKPGSTLCGHTNYINSVAYSPSGEQIASGSWDHTVRLWDAHSGKCRAVIRGFHGAVSSIAWKATSDGTYLVTGCVDKSVRVWQVSEKGDLIRVRLCWSSTHEGLIVTEASIQDVQGLSPVNKKLLEQRGAMGEPALRFHQATKQLSSMASAVSQFKLLVKRRTLDTIPAAPSSSSTEESAKSNPSASERGLFSHLA